MVTTTENCIFSQPVYRDNTDNVFRELTGNPIHYVQGQNWNFTNMTCSTTDDTLTFVGNKNTGANFFVNGSLSYGDAVIIWFLTLFLLYAVFKTIWGFWWKR